MKLKVSNPNNIVSSAFIKETDLAFSLFINTLHKWIDHDSCGGDGIEYVFYYYPNDKGQDTVTLIAENNCDAMIFSRLRFELHDKDQLWILFPVENVWLNQS